MKEPESGMSSPPNREEALFQAASQLTGAERTAFLNGACLDNPALRQRLDALLAANDEPDELSPKGKPAAAPTMKIEFADAPDEAVGQTIGRYKLLEKVGEGGCGVVYVAEQTQPVRRRVALKVIKLGMDTKAVVARFEAERQALAMMDHPNIAKVLDAGTTELGRPYFVMELVRGIRITDYCDQNQLSTKERLDLFIKVCQAIQHAHQKGIIHRDIKPSNILVTLHDGVPVPKVIDFGIAKATEGRLTDATVYTQLHQFIGTPAYMSPEQAEMSGLDIDTRSDIYSLGVLLYELLAGSTPFDANELMASGIDAMRKTIREREPMRPSTRFATLEGEDLTTTAKRRSADKAKLMHQLKGDLDWIVMKCLEKDRTRRYETANGLAFDLKRHLDNEPVLARPPSAAYKLQKAFRRNKLVFATAGSVAATLVVGLGVSTWMFIQERKAHQQTSQAEQEQSRLRVAAQAAQAAETKIRQLAEAREVTTRRNAYVSDLVAANLALQDGNFGQARALLAQHQAEPNQEDLRGFEWRYLWGRSRGDQIKTLVGHSNFVNCVAYSPDGTILASASSDHTVKLWNANTGELMTTCVGHSNAVKSVAFSPDGNLLASAGDDRLVRVWDAHTHEIVLTITNHSPYAVAFSGRFLALSTGDGGYGNNGGAVQLWDYTNGRLVAELPQSGNRAAFSPDGRTLATANGQGLIRLWNLDDRTVLKTFPNGNVQTLAFSPDGRRLAWGTDSGVVGLWELTQERPMILPKFAVKVYGVAFSPDGQLLATADQNHEITLWNASNGQILRKLRGHGNQVWAVAFSPDGKSLASGSRDDMVMLWNPSVKSYQDTIAKIQLPRWDKTRLPVFSRDGRTLAAATVGGGVLLWDAATGQVDSKRNIDGLPFTFSSDGTSLFTRDDAFTLVRRWDVATQSLLASNAVNTPHVGNDDSALSPDGKLIATSHHDYITLIDFLTGKSLFALPQKSDAQGVSFSADSTRLVTGNWDHTASVWDLKKRAVVWTVTGFRDTVSCISTSTNGVFAAGSWEDTIKICDADAKKELLTLTGHKAGVIQVDFSTDGRTLASGSDDGTVKLWNLAIGREVITFKTTVPQYFIRFSPDDKILATGGGDGVVHFWRAPSMAEIADAEKTGGMLK